MPNCCMTSLQGNYRSNLTITVEIVQFVRLRRGKSSWNQAFCCSGMDIHGLMSSNHGMPHPIPTSACIYCFRNRWYSYVNEGEICVVSYYYNDFNEIKQECIAQTYFDFHGQDILDAGKVSSCEKFGSRITKIYDHSF